MKKVMTILFTIGLLMLIVSLATMKTYHYLIPTCIGVLGLLIMMISIDLEEEYIEGICHKNDKRRR